MNIDSHTPMLSFLQHFSFSHNSPELFRVCQWDSDQVTVTKLYLCYRTILAVIYTSIYFFIWVSDQTYSSHWLIYLTNQSMLMLVIHLLLDMSLAIIAFMKQGDGKELKMGLLEKTSWHLATVTSSICVLVTIFFWAFLYPFIHKMSFENTFLHLFNTVW